MNLFAKSLVLCAATIAVAGCGSTSAKDGSEPVVTNTAQSLVTHISWSGAAATVSGWDPTSSFYLEVNENNDGAWLWFNRSSVDPTSWKCTTMSYPPKDPSFPPPPPFEWCRYTRTTWEYGSGPIAGKDFVANGAGAHLATTIGTAGAFWTERCSYDNETYDYSCSSNTLTGDIAIDWRRDNVASGFQNGVAEKRMGKWLYRTSGQYSQDSADASGSFLGATVASKGSMSQTRGSLVAKDMVLPPK